MKLMLVGIVLLAMVFGMGLAPNLDAASAASPHATCAASGCSYIAKNVCWRCANPVCDTHGSPVDHASICKK